MKSLFTGALLLFIFTGVFAQIEEFHFKGIEINEIQNQETDSVLFLKKSFDIYVKGDSYRVESWIGGDSEMSLTCIMNSETSEMLLLMDLIMGVKVYSSTNDPEIKEGYENLKLKRIEVDNKVKTGITRVLLDHECEQFVIEYEDSKIVLWVSDDFINMKGINKNGQISGQPLEWIRMDNDGYSHWIVEEISFEKLDDSLFDLNPPEGYVRASSAELTINDFFSIVF